MITSLQAFSLLQCASGMLRFFLPFIIIICMLACMLQIKMFVFNLLLRDMYVCNYHLSFEQPIIFIPYNFLKLTMH